MGGWVPGHVWWLCPAIFWESNELIHHIQQPPFEWGPSLRDITLEYQECAAKVSPSFDCKFKQNPWKCGAQSCSMFNQNWDGVKTGEDIACQNGFSRISVCKEVSSKKDKKNKTHPGLQDYNILTGLQEQKRACWRSRWRAILPPPTQTTRPAPLQWLQDPHSEAACQTEQHEDAIVGCTMMHWRRLFLGGRWFSRVLAQHTCIRMIQNASKCQDEKYTEKERPQISNWVTGVTHSTHPIWCRLDSACSPSVTGYDPLASI